VRPDVKFIVFHCVYCYLQFVHFYVWEMFVYLCQSDDAVIVSDHIALHSRMTVYDELERMVKEVVVT
jgi:DNA repair photolyase